MLKKNLMLGFTAIVLCSALGACAPNGARSPSSVEPQLQKWQADQHPGSVYQAWKPHNKAAD